MSVLIPGVDAQTNQKIIYSNPLSKFYEFTCATSTPGTWTQSDPSANDWKFFGYYDGSDCHASLLTYDFSKLNNLQNVSSTNIYIDSKSMVLLNQTANGDFNTTCDLLYFGSPTISNGIITKTPEIFSNDFDCTGSSGNVLETTIPLSVANNSTFISAIQAGNYTQSFMIFPNFSVALRTSLDSNGYDYAIGKFKSQIEINGDGFNCITIQASNWCNIEEEPWVALEKVLGRDYIGDWFFVMVFFPIPFSLFLITRNGAYAGFVCLPFLLVINTIDQVVFEVSLSLIAMASAFGFYEVIRKKLFE